MTDDLQLNGTTNHTLFRLDASIRVDGSHSREIADIVEQEWRNAHPNETILRRHIGVDPIPATSWATAVFASRTSPESRSTEQNDAVTLAAILTDELVTADALLFAVPLYNFGVSQHFKAWVDMVIADHRMAAGAEPIMAASRPCWSRSGAVAIALGPRARDGTTRLAGCSASSPTSGSLISRRSRPSSLSSA
jgi:NAD(P)H-dependent FMN reductase